MVRRSLDVLAAAVLLLLMLPLLGAAAAAVYLVDPGPVLYRQSREGRGGRPFQLVKLRTMVQDADQRLARLLATDAASRSEYERYFRLEHDPRLLPVVGGFLRRFSIDEIPQLWNVLRGDMSLVGPRPLATDFVAALNDSFLEQRRRIRPGLTGLWQVSGRSDLDKDALEQFDGEYLAHRSVRLDLEILARTPAAVLRREGAY